MWAVRVRIWGKEPVVCVGAEGRLRVLERQSLGRRKEALPILGGDQPEWTKPSGTSAWRER